MRARGIKPGFFKNEELAKLQISTRLLFIGLWCLADRKGRLEDRPKRIEAELYPYEKFDAEMSLQELSNSKPPFVIRYEVNSNRYIQIINFNKHQFTHPHERKSEIPSCNDNVITRTDNVHLYSGVLCTGVLYTTKHLLTDFEATWKKYPKKAGKNEALRHYRASVKSKEDADNCSRALDIYLKTKRVKEGFIKDGSTWFNDWQGWLEYVEPEHTSIPQEVI